MNWTIQRLALAAALGLTLAACGGDERPLATVDRVDLQRYAGTWHEIARLPQWFQRGCYNSTATYSLNDDGSVKVVNRCQREDDEPSVAEGEARVVPGHGQGLVVDGADDALPLVAPRVRRVARDARELGRGQRVEFDWFAQIRAPGLEGLLRGRALREVAQDLLLDLELPPQFGHGLVGVLGHGERLVGGPS